MVHAYMVVACLYSVDQPGMLGPPGIAALRGTGGRFRRFSSSSPLHNEFKGQPGLRITLSQTNKQNVQTIWQGQPNAYRDFLDFLWVSNEAAERSTRPGKV